MGMCTSGCPTGQRACPAPGTDGGASVCADITRAAGTAHLVVADVTRWSEIEAMRSDIERTLGPIEILVANAGGSLTASGPLEEMSEDGWRASVEASCLV